MAKKGSCTTQHQTKRVLSNFCTQLNSPSYKNGGGQNQLAFLCKNKKTTAGLEKLTQSTSAVNPRKDSLLAENYGYVFLVCRGLENISINKGVQTRRCCIAIAPLVMSSCLKELHFIVLICSQPSRPEPRQTSEQEDWRSIRLCSMNSQISTCTDTELMVVKHFSENRQQEFH